MDRDAVCRVLKEMADLLEVAEAGAFEVMAYRRGVRSLEDVPAAEFDERAAKGTVTELDGIGKGLATVIGELVSQGVSVEHERVKALFPVGLPEVLSLSGIGPKKVKVLWSELGVDGLDALEVAARDGRVEALRGFGAATVARVLRQIERRRSGRPPKWKQATSSRAVEQRGPRAAAPATGRLLAGTSGYAHPEWKGAFYPEDLKTSDQLGHYAARYGTVEINNSFYRFPTEQALTGWVRQTPAGFCFAVKANQRITHRQRLRDVGEVVASFAARCTVLGERLGPILYQLPPDLQRDDPLLADFLAVLPRDGRHAIEFRHASWHDDAVLAALAQAHVAQVVSDDGPREITTSFVYARLRQGGHDAATLDAWGAWFAEQQADGRDVFAYLKHEADGSSPEPLLARWVGTAGARRRRAPSSRGRRSADRRRQA